MPYLDPAPPPTRATTDPTPPPALARWLSLCVDATDPAVLGRFWATVLGRRLERLDDGDAVLRGDTPDEDVWVNRVPEPRTVKQRVHLDVRGPAALLTGAGATSLPSPAHGEWAVLADPEGGELCRFDPAEGRREGLFELVVDSADPARQAAWWAGVLGGRVESDTSYDLAWVAGVPGLPFESLDFVAVPEPKTVKNRVHWDVVVPDLAALVVAGARVLRPRDGEVRWTVLADPEGNEFCAFDPAEA